MKIALTQPQFDAAVAHLAQQGVQVTGHHGELHHSGVTVSYAYDGSTLDLEVVSKPFFLKESFLESQIEGWFAGQASPSKVSLPTGRAFIALILCWCLCLGVTGCTVKQQADAKAVVSKLIAYEPEVQIALDSLTSTVALFVPADAVIIGVLQPAFDADLAELKFLASAYVATPNDGALASLRTALEKVLADNADQFLAASRISNPTSVALAKASIVAVRQILLLMDGALQTTQTAAVNKATAQARTLKLKDIAPWINDQQKEQIARETGHSYRVVYAYETSQGF